MKITKIPSATKSFSNCPRKSQTNWRSKLPVKINGDHVKAPKTRLYENHVKQDVKLNTKRSSRRHRRVGFTQVVVVRGAREAAGADVGNSKQCRQHATLGQHQHRRWPKQNWGRTWSQTALPTARVRSYWLAGRRIPRPEHATVATSTQNVPTYM